MQKVEELKRQTKTVDLAVMAGKRRQSDRTGFVHYHPSEDGAIDTIPLFENFCFALALFRQKTSESVLEGKALIERLLGFQAPDGNFPVFLHEFPKCWDHHLGLKIAPVLIHILRDFHTVLPIAFKETLERALKKAIQPPQSLSWQHRYLACQGILPEMDESIDWYDWIVSLQILGKGDSFAIPFDSKLQMYMGNHLIQEKSEPQPLAIEYVLAEKDGFGRRLLRDHPQQIHSALLHPFFSTIETANSFVFQEPFSRFLWMGESVHSLSVPSVMEWDILAPNRWCTTLELSGAAETGRNDLFEGMLFCNISPETSLLINDKKGLVFRFGDKISLCCSTYRIDIRFEQVEGAGDFCGHISRSNRPGQIACRGANQYEAYDWQIGLRTLRRDGPCKIKISFELPGCPLQDP